MIERLKAVIAEQNYILGRFGEWWNEEGCPKIQYPEFPCQEEKNFNADPEQEGCKFDPYDCDMECERGCWVQYYSWLYRKNNGFDGKYAPDINVGTMEE